MTLDTEPFVHDFAPGAIHFGRGCVSDLGAALDDCGAENALVVCGSNVGANEVVMHSIKEGLSDRLVGVFDGTTPEKSVVTALEGVERMNGEDADALVPVGGGSTLDVATVMGVLHARGCSFDEVRREVRETGSIALPDERDSYVRLLAVPTTLAGADLSSVAGISVPLDGETVSSGVGGRLLVPDVLCYDPALFETTPGGVLCGSAMNGFDKGIEALYSRHANPITDATATRGLQYLGDALPQLGGDESGSDDYGAMDRAVAGLILVQYGVSIPGSMKLSLVHAFGHGLRRECGVQQGIAHAVMAPHVLSLLFDSVDGRRALLAEALNVEATDDEALAAGVVRAVTDVRDALGLPSKLRDVAELEYEDLPRVAEHTVEDSFIENGPEEFDPTVADIEAALEAAW